MSFRLKLLLLFSATIVAVVGIVAGLVSLSARRGFARADEQRTDALVAQFRTEFARRSDDVVRAVDAIASRGDVLRMAADLARPGASAAQYTSDAEPLARSQRLDFLELTTADGTIISSAQWSARFGYRDATFPRAPAAAGPAFLKREELPSGSALSLAAVRPVFVGDFTLYCVGGRRLDRAFLASLNLPTGMRALLYRGNGLASGELVSAAGDATDPQPLAPLLSTVRSAKQEAAATVQWSADPADSESFRALPLRNVEGDVLAVLLIGASRRDAVILERRILATALLVGAGGLLLGIIVSGILAARITRPVEQLAVAARAVAAGDLGVQVDASSRDELGDLAAAFNRMTRDLLDQRDRRLQAERVAAWRELARRLAHELKNPLFPLQITVENLTRARASLPPAEFDEVFHESTATLLQELANMQAIVGRFSDFAKMPTPELQSVDLNALVERVIQLVSPQLAQRSSEKIEVVTSFAPGMPALRADPDLLYRAVQNLVLNAIDAMPSGGTLTLRTAHAGEAARLDIADTGAGLTPEECARLFTPYYTTKQHGTGLGLAIVQSVVSDHGGKVWVDSAPQRGATFHIELPLNGKQ